MSCANALRESTPAAGLNHLGSPYNPLSTHKVHRGRMDRGRHNDNPRFGRHLHPGTGYSAVRLEARRGACCRHGDAKKNAGRLRSRRRPDACAALEGIDVPYGLSPGIFIFIFPITIPFIGIAVISLFVLPGMMPRPAAQPPLQLIHTGLPIEAFGPHMHEPM